MTRVAELGPEDSGVPTRSSHERPEGILNGDKGPLGHLVQVLGIAVQIHTDSVRRLRPRPSISMEWALFIRPIVTPRGAAQVDDSRTEHAQIGVRSDHGRQRAYSPEVTPRRN
jgi:hypothetical protein